MDRVKKKLLFEKLAFSLIGAGIIVFVTTLFLFLYHQPLFLFATSIDAEKFSYFGVFIAGTVGSMWSLASILLFYLTLTYQKEEIDNNRSESEKRLNQLAKENEQFRQERLEATFFQLLSSHHSLIKDIEIKDPKNAAVVKHGRECFVPLYNIYKSNFYMDSNEEAVENRIDTSFQKFFEKYQEVLGNYFRNLYNIFKFIDSSDIKNKKQYTNLIRAQLSNYELLLLFYNCLSNYGNKFNRYAVEYELFDNLITTKLIDSNHIALYPNKAFGKK